MQLPSEQYPNSPIREAVCEFRFPQGPETWDLSFPGLIYNELKGTFPRRIQQEQPQQMLSFSFGNPQLMPGGFNPADPSQTLMFWKEDTEDGAITIAPNRIGISHYQPYPGWEKFSSIINEAYAAFLKIVQPRSIDRLGLRYINTIEFDTEVVMLPTYFNYFPNFGDALPDLNLNVRMSADFAYNDKRDVARLQLLTVPGQSQNSIAVNLDIDYFLVLPGSVPITDVQEWLSQAHAGVGLIFEGCITDHSREMFGHRGGS